MAFVIVIAIVVGFPETNYSTINLIDLAGSLILFWTFLAILWYSKETQELKEVSIKRPLVTLYYGGKIKIKNYGEGVARDVKMQVNAPANLTYSVALLSSGSFQSIIKEKKDATDEEKIHYKEKEEDLQRSLESMETIYISYSDVNKKTKYKTILKWDPSSKDKFSIKKYYPI